MRALGPSLFSIVIAVALGCGGSSSSTPQTQTRIGKLVDGPVGGIHYSSGALSGTTDADGSFKYQVGYDVTFTLGGITFGTATPKAILTPMDLLPGGPVPETDPRVLRMVQLLMMLDADHDPTNGIAIPATVQVAAANHSFDFSSATDADLATFVNTTLGWPADFVTTTAALGHVRDTIFAINGESWFGDLGPPVGAWYWTIAPDGSMSGVLTDGQTFGSLTGLLAANGTFSATISMNGQTASVDGSLDRAAGTCTANLAGPGGVAAPGAWFRCKRSPVPITGFVATPVFDPPGNGVNPDDTCSFAPCYPAGQLVSMYCATPGATIRYFDGGPVDETSPIYTGPVPVESGYILRAYASLPGSGLADSVMRPAMYWLK
jgi:hypothetical protein